LLVDDHDDTVWTTAVLLHREGHEVEVAKDGASALQVWKSYQPDVVLLDIGLPDMHGWEVAAQIRQKENGERPVLIALSGYGTTADCQRSKEVGIDLHFTKPVEPGELLDVLAKIKADRPASIGRPLEERAAHPPRCSGSSVASATPCVRTRSVA